jgi:hypothetical protein
MWLENPRNDFGVQIMPVAIYARVSTEEQRERQSIETQLEFAKRYCELHELLAFRIFASNDGNTPPRHPNPSPVSGDGTWGVAAPPRGRPLEQRRTSGGNGGVGGSTMSARGGC